MDNFHIDITSEGDLVEPMKIAFRGAAGAKAEAYMIDENLGLIFFWSAHANDFPDKALVPLPFKLDAAGAADFARRWLAEQDYGKQPDHDGDNGRGWRLYNDDWGRVGGHTYSFVAVLPAWAMYGK